MVKKLSQKVLFRLKKTNPELADFFMRQQEMADSRKLIKKIKGEKGKSGKDGTTPNKEKLLELIIPLITDSIKGKDGKTPSQEELLDMIVPLITNSMRGSDGHTPTEKEITELIKPLIPKAIQGEEGKTPTKKELEDLMRPIINRLMPVIPSINEKKLIADVLSRVELPKQIDSFTELIDAPDKIQPGMTLVGSTDGKKLVFKRGKGGTGEQYLHGGGKLTVQDEGNTINENVTTLNFVGAGVTATGTRDITVDVAGGNFANVELDNLSNVAINTTLVSDTDITDDLGTQLIRWRDIYSQTLNTGNTAADTLKIRGFDVDGASFVDILTVTANNTVTADLNTITTIGGNAILDTTDIGVSVQAQGDILDDFNTLGAVVSDGQMIVGSAPGVFVYESDATLRATLGLTIGVDVVAPNQDTTGKSGSTDALNSATTTVNVSSSTAPTSGQVLIATSSTAATWQDAAVSGANTALSNLASVAINTSLISDTNNTDDLGSVAIGWKDVFLRTAKFDGSTSGTTTLQPTAVAGTTTLTLPAATDTLIGKATTDTLTNKTITATSNNVAAKSLHSATTVVDVSAATAPTTGQVLTATSTTAATWQDATGGATEMAIYQDQKPNGTSGDINSTAAFTTVTLNTDSFDNSANISRSGNTFTLLAGDYHIHATVPGLSTVPMVAIIFDVTNTANKIIGTNFSQSSGSEVGSSIIDGVLVVTTSTVFDVRARGTTGGFFIGSPASFGVVEVYTSITITKIA